MGAILAGGGMALRWTRPANSAALAAVDNCRSAWALVETALGTDRTARQLETPRSWLGEEEA